LVAGEMSNYRIKYIIITNSIKYQLGLCHCDGLVETIKLDILFIYFGAHIGVRKSYGMLTSSRRQHPGHRAHIAREPYLGGPNPQADPATGRNAPAQVNAAGGACARRTARASPARSRGRPWLALTHGIAPAARDRARRTARPSGTRGRREPRGLTRQATWRPPVGQAGCRAGGSAGARGQTVRPGRVAHRGWLPRRRLPRPPGFPPLRPIQCPHRPIFAWFARFRPGSLP
jgi:hypothetical protein